MIQYVVHLLWQKKCAYAPEYEKTFVRFPDMYWKWGKNCSKTFVIYTLQSKMESISLSWLLSNLNQNPQFYFRSSESKPLEVWKSEGRGQYKSLSIEQVLLFFSAKSFLGVDDCIHYMAKTEIKFIYSEKATKFCEIFTLHLTGTT